MNKTTLVLILGDLLALMAFVISGRIEHGLQINWHETTTTAIPFIVSWLAVASSVGLYKEKAVATIQVTIKTTLLVTIVAVPLGLFLRALYLHRDVPFPFLVVALVFTAIFMVGWRTIFVWLKKKRA
ncbi:DUF3054 domain-containing protein [Ammoniphilus resinae]|uniref:ABC-type phosphate/phosphonate transport system permease subunit n=1 Tax=Ammoniphilus resinae TaxID=861532 RepID=A0ABS4GTN7_9BACL|nr:DUF3054 domain-containing protein [Ammoniphilus resinae]MBP1933609.1 ABC-type phosphate/phosphonate transport system permease subunit [Ammoniphilus resinae]